MTEVYLNLPCCHHESFRERSNVPVNTSEEGGGREQKGNKFFSDAKMVAS